MKTPQPTRFQKYRKIYDTTQGWFEFGAAGIWDALLEEQSKQNITGHLFEIGVWHGKSAALLAMHAKPKREECHFVDLTYTNLPTKETLRRARGAALDRSIHLIEADSRDFAHAALLREKPNRFRFAHIDAEHTGGAVYGDLATCNTLLNQQGIVCLDDFMMPNYPQVTEAVFRYVRDHPDQYTMILCGYFKAFLARPHFAHRYLEFFAKHLIDQLEEREIAATLFKTTWPAEMNCFGIRERTDGRRYRGPDWDFDSIIY